MQKRAKDAISSLSLLSLCFLPLTKWVPVFSLIFWQGLRKDQWTINSIAAFSSHAAYLGEGGGIDKRAFDKYTTEFIFYSIQHKKHSLLISSHLKYSEFIKQLRSVVQIRLDTDAGIHEIFSAECWHHAMLIVRRKSIWYE